MGHVKGRSFANGGTAEQAPARRASGAWLAVKPPICRWSGPQQTAAPHLPCCTPTGSRHTLATVILVPRLIALYTIAVMSTSNIAEVRHNKACSLAGLLTCQYATRSFTASVEVTSIAFTCVSSWHFLLVVRLAKSFRAHACRHRNNCITNRLFDVILEPIQQREAAGSSYSHSISARAAHTTLIGKLPRDHVRPSTVQFFPPALFALKNMRVLCLR